MKTILICLAFVLVSTFAFASVSVDQVIKLSKLKTSDDVILQLIQKEGLERPITAKDVIFLKQQGVSDRVIHYMVKISGHDKSKMAPQEGQSTWLSENLRAYYTTGKKGKKIRVVTNLDEQGKRLGGEAPPDPQPDAEPVQSAQQYEIPREIRIVVEQDNRRDDRYEEPQYVDDRYIPPSQLNNSPYYPYYPAYPGYVNTYYPYRHHSKSTYPQNTTNRFQANWSSDAGYNKPRQPHKPDAPVHVPGSTPKGSRPRASHN